MKSIHKKLELRSLLVIGIITILAASITPARSSAQSKNFLDGTSDFQNTSDEEVMRAAALRRAVVEEFGTPEQIEAFDHPHEKPSAKPKKQKSKDTDQMPSYVYSMLEPSDIFLLVFSGQMYVGLEGGRLSKQTNAIITSRPESRFFSLLRSVIGQLPELPYLGDLIQMKGADVVGSIAHQEELSKLGQFRMDTARSLVQRVLPEGKLDEYISGDYSVKAALLFEAAYVVLDHQKIPNAYVLWLCDSRGMSGRVGDGAREQMSNFWPHDPNYVPPTWEKLSQEQKWRAVTETLKAFFRSGADSLRDRGRSSAFMANLPSTSQEKGRNKVLGALGKTAASMYDNDSADQKLMLEAAANSVQAAYQFLYPMLIGDSETDFR